MPIGALRDRHTGAVADPGDDRSLDGVAAQCIDEMLDVAGTLHSIAAPTERAAAVLLGYGWWLRVVRTADAVRMLHEHDYDHEASPLLRTALHHAAAIEWLRLDPDAVVEAVSFEHQARRQRLHQKATTRNWDLKTVKMGPPPSAPRPESVDLLERFEKLSTAVGAPNMYVAYMVESAYAHPSGISSDVYVDEHDGAVVLRTISKERGVPLRQVAVFAGVATRSFGALAGMNQLTALADGVGDRLGVATVLS